MAFGRIYIGSHNVATQDGFVKAYETSNNYSIFCV